MNKPKTYKIFLIAIIILTLINLGFAISFYVIQKQHRPDKYAPREGVMERGGRFMEKEIGFDEAQMQEFEFLRREFRAQLTPLHQELRNLNGTLIEEATSENPDTLKCKRISREIGDIHTEIKLVTYRHMMQVAKIASDEQMNKLDAFYLRVFHNDGNQPWKHRDGQFRHRHGRNDDSLRNNKNIN